MKIRSSRDGKPGLGGWSGSGAAFSVLQEQPEALHGSMECMAR